MNKTANMRQYWRAYRYARGVLKAAQSLGFKAEAKGTMCWVYGLITYQNRLTHGFYTIELQKEGQVEVTRHVSKQGSRLRMERNPATAGDMTKAGVFEVWAKGERFKPDKEEGF